MEPRAEGTEESFVNVGDYLRVLRRRKAWIALGVILGLLFAFAYGKAQPKSYTSTASVEVRPITLDVLSRTSGTGGNVDISTETQIAQSTSIADRVAKSAHLTTPGSTLLQHLAVTVPGKANVLQFSYTGSSPRIAQVVTQSFADTYLSARREQAVAVVKSLTKDLQSRISTLQSQLVIVQTTLATTAKGSSANSSAAAQQTQLSQQLAPLRARLDELNTVVIDAGRVIVPAGLGKPGGLSTGLLLAAGALIGLVLGILLAFLRELTDRRVREAADVERNVGVPVLASLPAPLADDGTVVLLNDATERHQQAYCNLAATVFVEARRQDLHTLLVADADRASDAQSVAANLAVAIAQSETRVALVSVEPGDVAALASVPNLRVVPLQSLTGRARLADPDRTRTLIDGLRAAADIVIIAVGPLSTAADALVLAAVADAVVVIAAQHRTRRDTVSTAVERLDQVNARLLGVALISGRRGRRRRRATSATTVSQQVAERERATIAP